VCRGRAWRRWKGDLKVRYLRQTQFTLHTWGWGLDSGRGYGFTYEKKNSVTETIDVRVDTRYHYVCYLDHMAKKNRDNPKRCSCWSCCNPRNAGLGNSRQVLTAKEGSALTSAVQDIFNSDAIPRNSKWRSRKWNTAARQSFDE
jgi:hypothetical protein